MAELFERVEVNRAPRWPLMTRLVALSVVAHGLFLVAVVYVPTLRGLLSVAGAMSGIQFVNEDYDRTLIGQRATVVQLGPHEKLRYPPDYFGAPAVEETTQSQPMVVQQAAPPPPPPMPVYRPRRVRTPRASAAVTPTPDEVAQASPTPTPDPEQEKQADAVMEKTAKQLGVDMVPRINTKPFEEIAVKGKQLFDQGKLNLNTAIEVTATAERNDDGTLNPDTVKLTWVTASDESTNELAQQLITALSQSKVLLVLKGAKEVRLALKLDQEKVSVKVMSDLPSEDEAKKTADGYATLVGFGRLAKKGTNEGELYNNLNFASEGKQFTMSFEMPKAAAGKMIADMLQKKAAAATVQNKS
ncbi:MAG TPA: hypothetical protein VKB12_21980 [Pyrinomonadaceae bacterium]|nr:hypothetical protein [Pyrinomonadaceae bacterium]